MKNAIILCSGGLDSVVTAYYVKRRLKYDHLTILFFNYLQRALKMERKCARKCAKDLKADFLEVKIHWLGRLSKSLINTKKKVRKLTRKDLKNTSKESNNWYVPCRNSLFINYALALAEARFIANQKRADLFVGFKNEGLENFPDTTQDFVNRINKLSKISTSCSSRLFAPLIKKDKEDIAKLALKLSINPKDTFSCYIGGEEHCGYCLACRLRQEGFYWANIKDPTIYRKKMKDFRSAN